MSFLVGFFVRSWTESCWLIFFDHPFSSKSPIVRPIFPTNPSCPSLVHPYFMSVGTLLAVAGDRPHRQLSRSNPSNPAIFCVGNVQAKFKWIFCSKLNHLIPRVLLIVSGCFDGDAIAR